MRKFLVYILILPLSISVYNLISLSWLLYQFSDTRCAGALVYSLCVFGILFATVSAFVLAHMMYRGETNFRFLNARSWRWFSYISWCFWLAFTIAIAIFGSFLLVFSLTGISYGDTTTQIHGRDGGISVHRGKNGSPTISANSLRDALLGQGYVHAQDRLSQLFLERTAAKGEISTILGKAGISHDTMARTYNFNATAHAMCDGLSEFHRTLMKSYANGINSYLASKPILPPDMVLYRKKAGISGPVKPWDIYDLCRSMVQYQTQLSSNCDAELKRWKALWSTTSDDPYEFVEKVYPGQRHFRTDESVKFSTILRDIDLKGPFGPEEVRMSPSERRMKEDDSFALEKHTYGKILNDNAYLKDHVLDRKNPRSIRSERSSVHKLSRTIISEDEDFDFFQPDGIRGSNAWVIQTPDNSRPLLANDPHLDMFLPGPWHYSTMIIDSKHEWYSGATHVGLPGMCCGSSNAMSWGLTLALTDICDLFIISPDNRSPDTHYVHNGKRKAYVTRKETIYVRGAEPKHLTIRETIYGPLLDNYRDTKVHRLAIWNAASQNNQAAKSLESFLNFVGGISTVAEMRDKVLHGIAAPALSIVMADIKGNVGYAITGIHPSRKHGHTGRYPIPGTGEFDHCGMIPMLELPWRIIPKESDGGQFIVAANNKIYPDSYKHRLGYEFYSSHRSVRIGEVLDAGDEKSIESMRVLQLDSLSNIWVENFRPWFAKQHKLKEKYPLLREMIREWDGEVKIGNQYGPILWEYMAFISDEYREREGVPKARNVDPLLAYFLTIDPDTANLVEEGWQEVSAKKIPSWGDGWGSLQLPHMTLANTPFRIFANRYPSKSGGDFTSVNMLAGSKTTDPSTRHFGPSLRLLIETGKQVYYAIPGGFSENPFSKYYDNLLASWATGDYQHIQFTD